ncbi:unnamed protein product [Durusdinium trenchii]|uniref:Uncharacterized protein n=1 Tax=Durusdinium trenchii TaxID=1381693 RepID=A0ABP0QWT7_9DINO
MQGYDPLPERLDTVEPLLRGFFEESGWIAGFTSDHELHARCEEEKLQYAQAGQRPSPQKVNFWETHIGLENIECHASRSRLFLQSFDDFRSGQHFSQEQLRFAVLVQHFVSQDTMDVRRLPEKRMHDDVFEGILTRSVNAQLITDAHRAEWAIEGNGFIVPKAESDEERKQLIADFGAGLVTALEEFLLSFCERRQLSVRGTEHVIQAVTTQMSQCGLANLDRCSRVGQYMVGGARLKQHVNYNISCTLAILGTLVSSALRWDHGPSNAPHVEMQQLALDTLCRWRRQIFPSRDVMLHSRSNWPDSLHVPWPFASEQSLFNLRWLGLYPSPRRWSRLVPTRTSNQD